MLHKFQIKAMLVNTINCQYNICNAMNVVQYNAINYRLVIYKYSVNLYFSIIDEKVTFVEIDSMSAWRL